MLQPDKLKKLNENAMKMAASGSSEEEIIAMKNAFVKQFGDEKPVAPVQKKKFALESSSEDGSLVSQKSPKPNMPVLTQEGFEQAMSKKKAVPTDMSGKALMKPASEIKKIKEKAAVLKGANKKSLETESPLEGAYPQAPLSEPIATLVTGVPGVPKIPTLTETIGVPNKKIIEQEYKDLDLDNPAPYLSASTYNRQPVNGIAINKDNFIEEVFTDEKLINLGIDPADFDGYLNLSGFKEDYNKRKDRGDFEVGSVKNPKLNEELYKSKLLSNYVRTKNDREVLKSKLQSVKASYEGKKIPVNKNAKVLDNNLIAKYTEENLPVLYKKLKEKDQLNKEKYKELTQDNTGLNSFAVGAKNFLKSSLNGFVDSVNKASTTVYDALGAEDLAEDLRYLNEERQLERPSERQVSFASGKVVDLAGKKYLVDEKGTVYDKDNEIVVNDLIEEGSLNKILEEAKKSKEEDWFFSPQGTAVQTGSVLGDMVWQIAYQASIGRVTKGANLYTKGLSKLSIPKGTADAIIAQSSLGYAQAYQTTLKEARDAGLTDKEAEQIAGDAAQRTAIWYGMTAPISPQTKAVESLFGSAEKELIKKAVGAYKTQGKQSFISTLNNGLKQISKKTVGIVEEGGKEAVQENIQQAGESLWINAQKNIEAGREISDDTMSFDDFVNTSILSFLSGGLVSNLSMPSVSSNKKTQVKNLYQLSQDMDVLDANLNEMVNNNIISKEDADNVKKDAIAVSRNITRIPKDTSPEIQLDVMRKLNEIEDLENSKSTLDKSFHAQIDEKIQEKRNEVKEIYDISLTKPIETDAVQEQSTNESTNMDEFYKIHEELYRVIDKASEDFRSEKITADEYNSILKDEESKKENKLNELKNKIGNNNYDIVKKNADINWYENSISRSEKTIKDIENKKNQTEEDLNYKKREEEYLERNKEGLTNAKKELESLKETTKIEQDAIQEQSTTEVPVQSETITSETLETGVSQPGPEVITEQATQEVAPSETITTTQEEVTPVEKTKIYHGGQIQDIDSISDTEPLFVTQDKDEAVSYAKGNDGNVSVAEIDISKIGSEDIARDILKDMGYSDEYMLHELIDPRFEDSYIGDENVKKLYTEIEKQGYVGISFMDTGIGNKKNVTNIFLINPKQTLKESGLNNNVIVREKNAYDLLEEGFSPVVDGNILENITEDELGEFFRNSETIEMTKSKPTVTPAEQVVEAEAAPVVKGIEGEQNLEVDTEKIEKVARISGVKPKNIKGLYDVNRKMFGQNRVKALASAVIMDRMIGSMAKRANVDKSEIYKKIRFEKSSEDFIPKNALKQSINSLIYELKVSDTNITDLLDVLSPEQIIMYNDFAKKAAELQKKYDKSITEQDDAFVKSFRENLIKTIDNAITFWESAYEKKSVLNKDGDLSEVKTNLLNKYKNKIDKLKSSRKVIQEELLSPKDITMSQMGSILFQVDAWHGSPYQFDKFELSKIGTGEGAQAFGWGLYFTDLESIAINYADKLSDLKVGDINFSTILENSVNYSSGKEKIIKTYDILKQKALDNGTPIKDFKTMKSFIESDYLYEWANGVFAKNKLNKEIGSVDGFYSFTSDILDIAKQNKTKLKSSKNLYKVSLHKGKTPDQYTWLEWDKRPSLDTIEQFIDYVSDNIAKSKSAKDNLQSKKEDVFAGRTKIETGQAFYEGFAKSVMQVVGKNTDEDISLALLEAGIDGVKYPSESISRGATSDTARGFNYVVFDENVVSIEEVIKFQKDANKARGAAMVAMDGQAVIYALTDPNVSTPLHEMAHVFEHYLSESERDAIIKSAGTKGWTIETSEFFARGFEKYLADGVSPIPSLQKLFDKFKEWLLDIYNGIKGSEIDIELNDKMKSIYDSIITESKETTPAEVDKIKSDIEASKERLKKAWDKYKTMGIAFDPKSNLAKDRELVKALVEYAYNNIRLGSYTASKLIEDLASQGFEMTRDGAKFIMDRASRKVQRDIDKTIGIKPKASEQKRINKAYSIGVATQKVATKEAKSEVKDLKGQVVDVFRAGIQAVKIAETTAKEKARDIKNKAQELAKYLDELKGAGKITANQATAMVKRFSKVNVLSEKSVNRFIDYATKVLNDADYNSKLTEARKTLSSLKKLSKDTEKNADLRVVASEFVKIDPSMVENIEEYNDIANKLKTALEGSKIRKANTKIVDTVNIDDVNTYVEKILTNQEAKIREEKIEELQSLFGVDAKEFSAEEIDALLESDEDIADDDAKIVRATLNKAFDVYSTVIDEILNTGVDPFTEEDVEFTSSQKKIIKDFMGIDLDTVTDNKEALRIIDSLINFIQNKSTAGMLKPIADFQGITGGIEAEKQGFKAEKLRKYWIPKLGKVLSKAFTTTPVLLEKMFKGVTRALEFEQLIGLSDLINNSSKAESDVNMIVKEYVKDFYKRKANGESYNSAYNDIERGVLAHMSRNVIGIESRMKKVFDKRKQEVLDTIELLSSKGNDSEQEIAKLIKKAYDKILDGSENIKDARLKTDVNNVEGVDYWVNQWNSRYEALSDLAINFYNKALGRDLGYTPDRIIKLQDKRGDNELEDIDSQFFANTDEILYDKKSGSLRDKQENRKIPKDMYIDFSFDKKNANAMNDALTDLYTAFDIRRVGAFLKSDSFRKIFKSSAEANLVDKRIKKFVRITRKKTPYSNDEISDFLKGADRLAKLGVTMSLASVKQPFVQTIPVMVSTAINAGGVGIGAAFDPKFNAWLNELGYAISNRGVESQAQLESMNKLLEKAADMPLDKAFKFVEKVQDESLKLLLVKGDIAIARASFKAYYEQSLKRQGEKSSNIDYSNHEVNKKAANYAQRMVDRQQNISNQALAGDLYTSESNFQKAVIKMLMPFSSFRMNQASRLSSDLGTLEYWNTSTKEDKIIALRSIAGYAAESATYRGLQIGTAMLFSSFASLIMGGDDEEEEKKYKESLIKGAAQGMFIDTFSPLPLADPFTQDALVYSVDELQNLMDITEDEKIKLFGSKDQSMLKIFGTYGIPVEKAKDIIMLGKLAYTKKYTDKYGNKKEISQDDADKLKILIAPLTVFTSVGFGSPDMSAIVRRSKKIAEKGSKKSSGARRVMSKEEYDRLTK